MNQALRDEKRICFITCVNDERKYEMCLARLKQLLLPENMQAEYIAVRQAKSMCAGYQQAMLMSNAKYKVYLHQDVLILDDSFVLRLLELFTNNKLCGIAGVVGSSNIPKEAVWWQGRMIGAIVDDWNGEMKDRRYNEAGHACPVMALDGLLLATQYDVPWRTDIFDGWHFYDVSACMEFKRMGYWAATIGQPETSCAHICGRASLNGYNYYRAQFIREYDGEY